MNSVSSLVVRIEGDAKDYYNTLKQVESAGQQMAKGMVTAGKRMTATLTAPLVGLGTAAFFTAANFEQAMAEVGAVANANAEEMKTLTASAEELGRTTSFSASEAASGMKFLAMAGFKTNEIVSAMPGMLNLAAAAAADLGTTADITSNVLSGFGLKAGESTRVADVLAKTLTTSNTDLQQLGDAMSYVAPVAASMGIEIEMVSAAIGIMSNAGIQGTKAGTGLRGVLMRLGAPTEDAAKMMQDLGVSIYDAEGKMKGLPEIVDQFSLAFEGMTDEQRMAALDQIVGKISAPAFLSMIAAGGDELRRFSDELENAGGTAATVAARQLDTFQGRVKLLKSALEGLAIAVGDYLLPAATKIVDNMIPAISGMATAFANMQPWAKKATLGFAALVAALGPALWAFGTLWGWISGLGSALAGLGSIIAGLAGWWVVLAAAIGAAIYFDVGGIRTRIGNAMQAFRQWGSALKSELLPEFEDFAYYAKAAIMGVASGGLSWDNFKILVQAAFDSIDYKSIREKIVASLGFGDIDMSFEGITKAVSDWWGRIPWQTIWGNIEEAYDNIVDKATEWWEGIPWKDIWDDVEETYDKVVSAVTKWWNGIQWQTIWGNVEGAYDRIVSAVTTWWNGIQWQTIWNNADGAYDRIVSAVTTWWNGIQWQTIWGNVEGAYDNIKQAVSDWWGAVPWSDMWDKVEGGYDKVKTSIRNWWSGIPYDEALDSYGEESGGSSGVKQAIQKWWKGIKWAEIWTDLEDVYESVKTAVRHWWSGVPFSEALDSYGEETGGHDGVKQAIQKWWASIQWAEIVGQETTDTVSGLVATVRDWWNGLSWSSIFGGGEGEGEQVGLLQQFKTWWDGIDWSTAIVNGLTNLLTGLTDGINNMDWTNVGYTFRVALEGWILGVVASAWLALQWPINVTKMAVKLADGIKAVINEMVASEEFMAAWQGFKDAVASAIKGFIFGTDEGLVAWEQLITDTFSGFLEGNWKLPNFEGWSTYITWPDLDKLTPKWADLIKFPDVNQWTGAFKEWLTSKFRLPGIGGGGNNDGGDGEGEAGGKATGTDYFPGGWSWVGENGPELLQLPRGARIVPQHKSAMIAGAASAGANNITIHVGSIDSDERVNQLANRILDTIDRRRS